MRSRTLEQLPAIYYTPTRIKSVGGEDMKALKAEVERGAR
jgi:hypothetical protein